MNGRDPEMAALKDDADDDSLDVYQKVHSTFGRIWWDQVKTLHPVKLTVREDNKRGLPGDTGSPRPRTLASGSFSSAVHVILRTQQLREVD